MSNYAQNPAMVRVDFFKDSGKWYTTEEMLWRHWDGTMQVHDAFIRSLQASFNGMYDGMTAVCLEPYHEHAYPVMLKNWNSHIPNPIKT